MTWQDIDFTSGLVDISKSVSRKIKGRPFTITSPKNLSSYRKIKLPQVCVDLIAELKNREDLDGEYIFYGKTPLKESTYKRYYDITCKAAAVKRIRIHDFRHSHASLLISKGENIVAVAKRLGHSNIEQTLNTYSHLMPNAEAELIKKLDIHFDP